MTLQTVETYKEFIDTSEISFGGNNFEIYFEEDDFDKYTSRLRECDIEYIHPIKEHSWGQLHLRYLKEYRRGTYITLLTGGRLNAYFV